MGRNRRFLSALLRRRPSPARPYRRSARRPRRRPAWRVFRFQSGAFRNRSGSRLVAVSLLPQGRQTPENSARGGRAAVGPSVTTAIYLLAQAEPLDQLVVPLGRLLLEVVEQAPAPRDELQQAAAGMMILRR